MDGKGCTFIIKYNHMVPVKFTCKKVLLNFSLTNSLILTAAVLCRLMQSFENSEAPGNSPKAVYQPPLPHRNVSALNLQFSSPIPFVCDTGNQIAYAHSIIELIEFSV